MQREYQSSLRKDKRKRVEDIMERIKAKLHRIVLQEVPSEISLCIYVGNCKRGCPGCHSPYLAESDGVDVEDNIQKWIDNDRDAISCVLFMGGDQDYSNEDNNLERCIDIVRANNLKVALYSGATLKTIDHSLLYKLNYVKIGPYVEELGGLSEPTTNQRIYRIEDHELIDITKCFWKKLFWNKGMF